MVLVLVWPRKLRLVGFEIDLLLIVFLIGFGPIIRLWYVWYSGWRYGKDGKNAVQDLWMCFCLCFAIVF